MQRKFTAVLVFLFMIYIGIGAYVSNAQDVEIQIGDFGASQVFSTFFQAQRVGDLVLFLNGSVASANVLDDEIQVETADGDVITLLTENLSAIRFSPLSTRFFVSGSEPIDGTLLTELNIDYALGSQAAVTQADINAIVFKLEPITVRETSSGENGEEEVVETHAVHLDLSQIFPIMTRMFASMSNFDTAIMPDNQLASVTLENREDLEITINSVNFGTFTFPADEVAFIEFAQEEGDRDVLVLNDGDRVSGEIVLEAELNGTLGMGEGGFTFDEAALRANFKQLVFQLPTDLFGGGGGGQGVVVTPDNN